MEISQIRYFCVIVEVGNLRKSAELLKISPGALSKAMSVLQSDLGTSLFSPQGRGLTVTDEGRAFYSQAQRLLSEWELLAKSPVAFNPTIKPIRIASIETFTTYFLGQLIASDFSNDSFSVLERLPGQIEEAVLNREVDIGITFAPVPMSGLDFLRICSFQKRSFARKGAFNGTPLSEIPFSAPKISISNASTGETDLDGWPRGVPRLIKYNFDLLETALVSARLGLCAIFCPDFVIPLQNAYLLKELQLEPLAQAIKNPILKRDIFLVKRAGDPEGSTIKKIARQVRMLCGHGHHGRPR